MILSASLLFLLSLAQSPSTTAQATAWPHLQSDIPSEPRVHFGTLSNGVRWAWMDNPEPKKRSYLRLHVNAGSLSEEESERGLAHFLEHMCFNGTKHHPGTSLIEWFQKNGMDFGADTNAYTSYSQTVYMLDLPTSDEATLTEGLVVLRDFTDGLLLEPAEVESEKGVVDAEERESDSPGRRVMKESFRLQFSGTRIPVRVVIGEKAVRSAFTPETVRAFHSRWYRPENLTLVLVGDLQGADPTAILGAAFDDLAQPASPLAREPASGTPDLAHRVYAIHEQDMPSVMIEVQMTSPWKERPVSRAQAVREIPLEAAHSMLNLRFAELRKSAGAPFLYAFATDAHDALDSAGIRVQDGETLGVNCAPDKWREALAVCEQELRRAIEHGFEPRELEEVRANALRELEEAVEREKTRDSSGWLEELLAAAESGRVPSNASVEREIAQPALVALDVAACQKALKNAWSTGTLVLSLTGPIDLGPDAPKILQGAYETSRATAVEGRESAELAPFAYASKPEQAGKIAEREHVKDLDVHVVRFENGVRLLLKKTDFEQKQILVSVPFARGQLDLDPSKPALGWVAQRVFDACGLAAHSSDDLRKLFAGKKVSAGFLMVDDQFELNGGTTREDLIAECELLCARLMHAGWREEGARLLAQQIPVIYEGLKHQHGGPLMLEFLPEIYSGDRTKGLPARSEVEAVKLDEVRAWLGPLAKAAAIDVVMVGDLDVEESVLAAAQTFGALPKREALVRGQVGPRRAKIVTGLRRRYEIDSQDEKALVWVMFPATDGRDPARKRGLKYLAEILGDRLRVEVREKLSATYSPGAFAQASEVFEDDGWVAIQALAEPAHVEPLVDAVLRVASALAENGPTKEEVDRLREPALNHLRDARRTNSYWWNLLARMHSRSDVYEELRTDQAWLETVKAEDLAPLAQAYLQQERASIAIVVPKARSEAASVESAAPKDKE